MLAIGGDGALAAAGAALAAEREAADAMHAIEVLSLEGSGRGRALLRPHLSAAAVGLTQPF